MKVVVDDYDTVCYFIFQKINNIEYTAGIHTIRKPNDFVFTSARIEKEDGILKKLCPLLLLINEYNTC